MLRNHGEAWDSVERGKDAFYDSDMPSEQRMNYVMRGMQALDHASALCGSLAFPVVPLEPLPKPLTLTGDDWRAAWAEARDREADKALDAVY